MKSFPSSSFLYSLSHRNGNLRLIDKEIKGKHSIFLLGISNSWTRLAVPNDKQLCSCHDPFSFQLKQIRILISWLFHELNLKQKQLPYWLIEWRSIYIQIMPWSKPSLILKNKTKQSPTIFSKIQSASFVLCCFLLHVITSNAYISYFDVVNMIRIAMFNYMRILEHRVWC
jgi:hypothetical protein